MGKIAWQNLVAVLEKKQSEEIQICGTTLGDTVGVKTGWNMIGVYEEDIPVSQITTTPPGIISSNFFTYEDGYDIADILKGIRKVSSIY